MEITSIAEKNLGMKISPLNSSAGALQLRRSLYAVGGAQPRSGGAARRGEKARGRRQKRYDFLFFEVWYCLSHNRVTAHTTMHITTRSTAATAVVCLHRLWCQEAQF